ncbi:DUF7255 family protein [Arthrobacter sp. D1-17]
MFRELGGVPAQPAVAPKWWDIQADDLLIEFDEDLHFNRYRNLSLATLGPRFSLVRGLPPLRCCMEGMCLKAAGYGGKWASPSSDRMFGGSDAPGLSPEACSLFRTTA